MHSLKSDVQPSSKESTFGTTWTPLFTTIALVVLVLLGMLIRQPLIIPPLAATAAYVFGAPGIPGTQPRSILAGHVLSAALGFALLHAWGSHGWVAALAAGVAFFGMNSIKLFHIPAIATAALVVLLHPENISWFLFDLTLSSVVLSLIGFIIAKLTGQLEYPLYW